MDRIAFFLKGVEQNIKTNQCLVSLFMILIEINFKTFPLYFNGQNINEERYAYYLLY